MELCLVKRPLALIASLAVGLYLTTGTAHAQVAGESVNMVSGIGWPGGDPFLQRQNEPTLAVSSVNPMHLMAGANDYRAVDIKVPDADVKKINGDAWLGVFKSLDGGQNWKSVLLPGYPQDTGCPIAATPAPVGHTHHHRCGHNTAAPSVGGQYALCGLPAAADPVMRAGTDGMFFFAGINFQRDKLKSRVFLARYIDLNNRENGDATKAIPTDPLYYVDTRIIADNPPNVFIDKPWMTVDVPRAGATWCEIPVSDDQAVPKRRFLGGTIYVGWSEFTLPDDLPTTTSKIKFTYSTDCGKTWVTPYALNTKNSVLNQGLALSVEPTTGRVYAAWRRIATPTNKQTDAIMATRSGGRKKNFSNPRVVAKLTAPFDQGTSYTAFRTEAFPAMAISTDGTSSWAHLAWQQRKAGTPFESRVVMSTAKVHPPPVGEDDDDEIEDFEDETRLVWSTAKAVDDGAAKVGDDAGNVFSSGHQVMPALTFGQGKLMLIYYDTRFDHTRRYFEPLATPTSDGRFYKETLAPVGELAPARQPVAQYDPPAVPEAVFNSWINDGSLFRVRHTVDVRVASAPAGGNPVFTSVLASKFPFGMRGDEGRFAATGLKMAGFGTTGDIEVVSAEVKDATGKVTAPATLKVLQQLQSNPPNFPMFKNGSVAFMGDYIDIQGPAFVSTAGGGWAFNSAATPAPVFHAVWTSNQDVQVPRVLDPAGYPDWSKYAPPYCATCNNQPQPSRYANNGTTTADACVVGAEASRDQNIYTSRITEGLLVATPQNMKPLSPTVTRAFVVSAQNSTDKDMVVSFGATVPSQGVPASVPTVDYSFTSDLSPARRSLTSITVPKRSYVTRSLFVKLPTATGNPLTTLNVSVTETGCVAAACRSGFLTLNPASALGSLVQPDTSIPVTDITLADAYKSAMTSTGLTDPSWVNGGKTDPSWVNPSWVNPSWVNPSWVNLGYSDPSWVNGAWTDQSWSNPPLTNSNWAYPSWTDPSWVNPSWVNPSWVNPSWVNPSYTDPSWVNPSWVNPSWVNPSWVNPSWVNPSWVNPSWVNPSWVNSSMSDLTYTITNTGNTTTSYHVKIVGPATTGATAAAPSGIQMNMTKWYNTPAAVNCKLIEVPRFLPVVEVPDVPLVPSNTVVDPGATDGSASNATVALAPGESALIVLRGKLPMKEMATLGTTIGVAAVPASYTPTTTTYQNLQTSGQGSTVGVGRTSSTSLTYDRPNATATVNVTGAGGTPTGAIVIILNGKQLAATYPLGANGQPPGQAMATFNPAPEAGDTLAAYYAGDGVYMASTSAPVSANPNPLVATTTTLSIDLASSSVVVAVNAATGSQLLLVGTATVAIDGGAATNLAIPAGCPFVTLPPFGSQIVSCATYPVTAGPHTVTAAFAGNTTFAASTATPLTFNYVSTTLALRSVSGATADLAPEIVADLTMPTGSNPIPTVTPSYSVGLSGGGNLSLAGCAEVAAGKVCTYARTVGQPLAQGAYTATATFNGSGTYFGSTAANMPFTVGAPSSPTASMKVPRFALAAGEATSTTIRVVGGMKYTVPTASGSIFYDQSEPVRGVESYDVTTGLWSAVQTPTVPTLPFYPASVQTGTGLYLVGGQAGASMIGIRSWLEYNLWSNTWWVPAETIGWPWLATPRTMAAVAAFAGSLCLPNASTDCFHYMVTGGDDGTAALATTEFFTSFGARAAGPAMNTPRFGHVAVMVGNRYYVIGGRNTLSGTALNDMEYCDVTVDSTGYHISPWTPGVAPPSGAGRYNSTAAVYNGKIYVMGGAANTQVRAEVFIFDTATGLWSQGTNLTIPVAQAAAVRMGTTIFLVGGDKGNSAPPIGGPYGGVQIITP